MKRIDMAVGELYLISPGGSTSYGYKRQPIDRIRDASAVVGMYLGHDVDRVGQPVNRVYSGGNGSVTDLAMFAVSHQLSINNEAVPTNEMLWTARRYGYHEVLMYLDEATGLYRRWMVMRQKERDEFQAPMVEAKKLLLEEFNLDIEAFEGSMYRKGRPGQIPMPEPEIEVRIPYVNLVGYLTAMQKVVVDRTYGQKADR